MNHEFQSAEERRAAMVAIPWKETGLDEAMIETLIRRFYARVSFASPAPTIFSYARGERYLREA